MQTFVWELARFSSTFTSLVARASKNKYHVRIETHDNLNRVAKVLYILKKDSENWEPSTRCLNLLYFSWRKNKNFLEDASSKDGTFVVDDPNEPLLSLDVLSTPYTKKVYLSHIEINIYHSIHRRCSVCVGIRSSLFVLPCLLIYISWVCVGIFEQLYTKELILKVEFKMDALYESSFIFCET